MQIYGRSLPSFSGKYLEPFLGGGAVFFHSIRTQERPFVARLGDANPYLIRCYSAVRDDPELVSDRLEVLQAGYAAAKDKSEYYYDVRRRFTQNQRAADASEFIFLNRTCWNGLWRVNAKARFNVPFGAPKTELVVPTRDELVNAAHALQGAFLRATSWENTLAFAEQGDFVFVDPPYFSETLLGRDNYSTKYQRKVFGLKDHERLARAVRDLANRGVAFVLTNSAEPEMESLYRSLGLSVAYTQLPRNINSRTDQRSSILELAVTPGPPVDPTQEEASVLLDLDSRSRRRRDQRLQRVEPANHPETTNEQ